MLTALDSGMTDIANYSIEEGAKILGRILHTGHKYSFTSMVVRVEATIQGIHSLEDKGKRQVLQVQTT